MSEKLGKDVELKLLEHQLIDLKKPFISLEDKARMIQRYCELKTITPYALAKQLGMNDAEIYKYLQALNFTPSVKKHIKEGSITERTAAKILFRLKPDDARDGKKAKVLSEAKIDSVVNKVVEQKLTNAEVDEYMTTLNSPEKKTKFYIERLKNVREFISTEKIPDIGRWEIIKELKKLKESVEHTLKLIE